MHIAKILLCTRNGSLIAENTLVGAACVGEKDRDDEGAVLGCWFLVLGFWMPFSGYWIFDIRGWILDA
jgi:hypothetical protein